MFTDFSKLYKMFTKNNDLFITLCFKSCHSLLYNESIKESLL